MWGAYTCPYTRRAENLLRRKGVVYERVSIWRYLPGWRGMLEERFGPRHTTIPQIVIGEKHVGGCDALVALERDRRLDRLLWPEGAPPAPADPPATPARAPRAPRA